MNKYIMMLPAMALVAMFSACTFQQEDYFEESAALRIEKVNNDIKSKLVAASTDGNYGWVMQYFVAGTDDYDFEGFNLFAKFTNSGSVTLGSDHRFLRNGNKNKYTEYSSCYEMINEEGAVLAFNTWNDVLTVFVDPVDCSKDGAPDNLINDGEGMNGDDRLVNLSYSDDEMLFRGERHGAKVHFVKLTCPAEEYLQQVSDMKALVGNSKVTNFKLQNADTTIYFSGVNNGYFTVCERIDDPLKKYTESCVFTPTGLYTENVVRVKNDSCQEFVMNADQTALTCNGVTMTPCWMRYIKSIGTTAGKMVFTADGACSSLATMYNTLSDGIHAAFASQTLTGISFGKSNEGGEKARTGIVFICSTSKKSYYVGFTASVTFDEDNNTATIVADATDPSNNYTNYKNKGLGSAFTDIVSAMNGTYTLTPDNAFNPCTIVWTKQNDSSFYFATAVK